MYLEEDCIKKAECRADTDGHGRPEIASQDSVKVLCFTVRQVMVLRLIETAACSRGIGK